MGRRLEGPEMMRTNVEQIFSSSLKKVFQRDDILKMKIAYGEGGFRTCVDWFSLVHVKREQEIYVVFLKRLKYVFNVMF